MRIDAEAAERWLLEDRASALEWCRERDSLGIRCTLDILGRYSHDADAAMRIRAAYASLIRAVERRDLRASLSVKPTTLGAAFDRELGRRNLLALGAAAARRGLGLELDMEGRNLVDFTLHTAIESAGEGFPVTVTLQAYLDRTPSDLECLLGRSVRVRLVKGAYVGDAEEFVEVQRRLKALAERLSAAGQPFSIGTHDPEIIEWARSRLGVPKARLVFGFLKGLAERTKLELAGEGWTVVEYVPFGKENEAYIARRQGYLRKLAELGRSPAP